MFAENKITKIKKRDGGVVDFDADKITRAIYKAQEAIGQPDFDLAKEAFSLAKKSAYGKKYNVIILDEFCVALRYKLLNLKRALHFKRYYKKGICAKMGIEY